MEKTNFKDIPISTRTIIVATNTMIDIENLFNNLPITPYTVQRKKRGRKKKDVIESINNSVESGSIVSLKYQDQVRGVELKVKKKETKFFRNAVTIIMSIDNKFINLKVSTNGKFQVTGCKHFDHCKKAIINIFNIVMEDIDVYLKKYEEDIDVLFNNVMTNKDFSMGFQVNREVLDNILNKETKHNSLLETSFGYTGINLKMLLNNDIDRSFNCLKINIKTKDTQEYILSYQEYISKLTEKERTKENKKRHITFLIFQSGNVIMSGINEMLMEKYYNEFYKVIETNYEKIKEKLTV